jgi:hypothetical protein
MGKIEFSIDPKAYDPAALRDLIDTLMNRPSVENLLTSDRDRQVIVTDSIDSLTQGNQARLGKAMKDADGVGLQPRGYTQKLGGPLTIWSHPELEKIDRLKGFVHELGHVKGWPNSGPPVGDHGKNFYDQFEWALKAGLSHLG